MSALGFDHVKWWPYSSQPGHPLGVESMQDVLYISRAGSISCYIGFRDEEEVEAFKQARGFGDEWKMVDRREAQPAPMSMMSR